MTRKAQIAYRIATGLFLIGVLGQVLLAGLGIFSHPANFFTHKLMGGVLHVLSFLMWVLAARGRLPLQTTQLNGVLFGVLTLQGLLPHLRGMLPVVAALHPVMALLIFWIALTLARQAQVFAGLRQRLTIAQRQPVYRQSAHASKS
ncbi:MAG TPA: DUF6220 domain-containing protein [Anaerolineae bacterium]|nr:DUF6220 domain-containing protein [Anaerolineae bacterium]